MIAIHRSVWSFSLGSEVFFFIAKVRTLLHRCKSCTTSASALWLVHTQTPCTCQRETKGSMHATRTKKEKRRRVKINSCFSAPFFYGQCGRRLDTVPSSNQHPDCFFTQRRGALHIPRARWMHPLVKWSCSRGSSRRRCCCCWCCCSIELFSSSMWVKWFVEHMHFRVSEMMTLKTTMMLFQ